MRQTVFCCTIGPQHHRLPAVFDIFLQGYGLKAAAANNKPVIDLDGWGAVSYQTEAYSETDFSIIVIDHDGINEDGSSHTVTVTFTVDSIQYTVPLSHQGTINSTSACYEAWIEHVAVSGDYLFSVTDPEGNTGTATDFLVVTPLKIPTNLSSTPGTGTTPVLNWDLTSTGAEPTHFRVRIYDPEGNTCHWGNTATAPYQVPPGILEPNTTYTYRIESRDGHLWCFDVDNLMKAPVRNADNPSFTTGLLSSHAPFLDMDGSGLETCTSKNFGANPSFYAWFKVFDAQGVPGNIKSVIVTTPPNGTFPLHFDSMIKF